MKKKYWINSMLGLLISSLLTAQNFSGLQNKILVKANDMSAEIGNVLGSFFTKNFKGSVDSVKVLFDSEKELQLQIYFTGFENGYMKINVTDASKANQASVAQLGIDLTGKTSPQLCALKLKDDFPKGQFLESPFLKIESLKSQNKVFGIGAGFILNKKWKVDLDAENVVIQVKPRPLGSAALLKASEVKDVIPTKKILFDPKFMYLPLKTEVVKPVREIKVINHLPGSLQSYRGKMQYTIPTGLRPIENTKTLSDNISGTWINTDANTSGITKLIITNNNQLEAFGKCSPTDCQWGKVPLTDKGNNSFEAIYDFSFKTSKLSLSYANNEIIVSNSDIYKDGRGSRANTYSFKKNFVVAALLVKPIYSIKDYAIVKPVATGAATDYSSKGADNASIYLWNGLKSDIEIEKPQDISNINMNIFPDKNPNSGVFYFLPADYHLKWEEKEMPEKGYNFSILYGGQSASDNSAPVRMSAKLTAGISNREVNFIKTLLKASISNVKDLKILPLRENPVFSFQSILTSQYNIPQNKIAVESSTDLSQDIRVAWQTDADTKEFIQTALTAREGIPASVILKPQAEGIIDQQVPVNINLADNRTLGKITLDPATWRAGKWRNKTPYPLLLKYLNILKITEENGSKIPIIYSWSLDNIIVPSKAQLSFDASLVPVWLDAQESALMWIDYSIPDCKSCDQAVFEAVTGGVSGNKTYQAKFTIPPAVFDSMKADYFIVTIRSKQVDPNGESVMELPNTLKITRQADKEFSLGPLYLGSDGKVQFEYKMTIATTDGDFIKSEQWNNSTEKDILLGKSFVKGIFSSINH